MNTKEHIAATMAMQQASRSTIGTASLAAASAATTSTANSVSAANTAKKPAPTTAAAKPQPLTPPIDAFVEPRSYDQKMLSEAKRRNKEVTTFYLRKIELSKLLYKIKTQQGDKTLAAFIENYKSEKIADPELMSERNMIIESILSSGIFKPALERAKNPKPKSSSLYDTRIKNNLDNFKSCCDLGFDGQATAPSFLHFDCEFSKTASVQDKYLWAALRFDPVKHSKRNSNGVYPDINVVEIVRGLLNEGGIHLNQYVIAGNHRPSKGFLKKEYKAPLHTVCSNMEHRTVQERIQLIELFLEYNADINLFGKREVFCQAQHSYIMEDFTAVHLAIDQTTQDDSSAILEFLIAAGANTALSTRVLGTPLRYTLDLALPFFEECYALGSLLVCANAIDYKNTNFDFNKAVKKGQEQELTTLDLRRPDKTIPCNFVSKMTAAQHKLPHAEKQSCMLWAMQLECLIRNDMTRQAMQDFVEFFANPAVTATTSNIDSLKMHWIHTINRYSAEDTHLDVALTQPAVLQRLPYTLGKFKPLIDHQLSNHKDYRARYAAGFFEPIRKSANSLQNEIRYNSLIYLGKLAIFGFALFNSENRFSLNTVNIILQYTALLELDPIVPSEVIYNHSARVGRSLLSAVTKEKTEPKEKAEPTIATTVTSAPKIENREKAEPEIASTPLTPIQASNLEALSKKFEIILAGKNNNIISALATLDTFSLLVFSKTIKPSERAPNSALLQPLSAGTTPTTSSAAGTPRASSTAGTPRALSVAVSPLASSAANNTINSVANSAVNTPRSAPINIPRSPSTTHLTFNSTGNTAHSAPMSILGSLNTTAITPPLGPPTLNAIDSISTLSSQSAATLGSPSVPRSPNAPSTPTLGSQSAIDFYPSSPIVTSFLSSSPTIASASPVLSPIASPSPIASSNPNSPRAVSK